MSDEPPIDELIVRFDAFLLKQHESRQAYAVERRAFIDRELADLRELWWGFDPLGLTAHRELIEDEYDDYVISSYGALRDEGDLEQVVTDALEKMAMQKGVSMTRIVDFCQSLRKWWFSEQ